jgi:hypothetical protein
MRGERGKPHRQRPLPADEDPHHRSAQIVVRQPAGHRAEVREGPDVAIEEADLVLALVDPSEVAAGVHQPHQEEPRLAPRPTDIDEHLEEIDFGEVTGPIRERHEDLTALALPLGDRFFDEVTPTRAPSPTSNSWSRVAVSCCLPPVHCTDSASSASTRALTFSQTGRARGADSFRIGTASSTYFRTVTRETPNSLAICRWERPSTNTL